MHNFPSLLILPYMGKELNFLPLKYKAMGKESNFLFSLNAQLSPTCMGKESKPGVKAILLHKIFPKIQSYPSPQFYKSFPFYMKGRICPNNAERTSTNPFPQMKLYYYFFSSFFILCLFHFILFIFCSSFFSYFL